MTLHQARGSRGGSPTRLPMDTSEAPHLALVIIVRPVVDLRARYGKVDVRHHEVVLFRSRRVRAQDELVHHIVLAFLSLYRW